MNKIEFIKNIEDLLVSIGFVKVKNTLYRIENEEMFAMVDIQKSNYDADS